jgi:hypothetical protein
MSRLILSEICPFISPNQATVENEQPTSGSALGGFDSNRLGSVKPIRPPVPFFAVLLPSLFLICHSSAKNAAQNKTLEKSLIS